MAGKFFSATELNKFCYCKMQWYYERVYGAKQISALRRELAEREGWEPSGDDAFLRGRAFHEGYVRRFNIRKVLKWALLILLSAIGLYFYFRPR